jgi:lipid-A-disaccharide synthase-like uncharacterized protein
VPATLIGVSTEKIIYMAFVVFVAWFQYYHASESQTIVPILFIKVVIYGECR